MVNFETVCEARPGSAGPKLSAQRRQRAVRMHRPRLAALPAERPGSGAQSPRAVPPGPLSARTSLGGSIRRSVPAEPGAAAGQGEGGPRSAGRSPRGAAAPGGGRAGGCARPGRWEPAARRSKVPSRRLDARGRSPALLPAVYIRHAAPRQPTSNKAGSERSGAGPGDGLREHRAVPCSTAPRDR